MKSVPCPARRGRPRTFDKEAALEQAMRVFWVRGYEGASMADLTRAMKINRPSLYAAFGNKEALFHCVLERYAARHAASFQAALNEPTARRVAEAYLQAAADSLAEPARPRGCLMVQGALACSKQGQRVRQHLIAQRASGLGALRQRLRHAKAEGDLPADSSPEDLARYLSTITHGMSVQAVNGATSAELRRVAKVALQGFPR